MRTEINGLSVILDVVVKEKTPEEGNERSVKVEVF